MNDFLTDDKWQREQRDAIVVPQLYRRHFWMRYLLMDGNNKYQERGIDTVILGKGDPVYVEEKIVRWPEERGKPYEAFALETKSCTTPGLEKTGWMDYGKAHRLLYCFQLENGSLDCWWLDFRALQKWFWTCHESFNDFQMTTRNRSAGKVVPIEDVCRQVSWANFQLAGV